MMKHAVLWWATLSLLGCAGESVDKDSSGYRVKGSQTKDDSSVEAVFITLDFDGELLSNTSFNPRSQIDKQLLYSVGHLNGQDSNGVGRLDRVVVTDIQTRAVGEGQTQITYRAVLPAAWGRPADLPETHVLRFPKDVSFGGLESFTEKYKENCVDSLAHDVDSGIMWYYYRPNAPQCAIDPEDVVALEAKVELSASNTTGKYPEYHKVWEDDALKAVAIFGKAEEGATWPSDSGISAFNYFVSAVKQELGPHGLVTIPGDVSDSPGIETPDVTLSGTLPDGRRVEVVAMLIDGVRTARPSFDGRYEQLTPDADLIAYMGHSGLGANIQALAQKGSWRRGQYAMVYMGGCDTYAYVDSALADAHVAVNDDDPKGTKYMDIITNAQPAFFHQNPRTAMIFLRGLMDLGAPKTFEDMFASVDDYQVILVSGEEDNVFVPGGFDSGEVDANWGGLERSGELLADQEIQFVAPRANVKLPAGSYVFEMEGSGDADLYVKIGSAPTQESYDCRPYLSGANEICEVEINSPATIYGMVRGFSSSSDYTLIAYPKAP